MTIKIESTLKEIIDLYKSIQAKHSFLFLKISAATKRELARIKIPKKFWEKREKLHLAIKDAGMYARFIEEQEVEAEQLEKEWFELRKQDSKAIKTGDLGAFFGGSWKQHMWKVKKDWNERTIATFPYKKGISRTFLYELTWPYLGVNFHFKTGYRTRSPEIVFLFVSTTPPVMLPEKHQFTDPKTGKSLEEGQFGHLKFKQDWSARFNIDEGKKDKRAFSCRFLDKELHSMEIRLERWNRNPCGSLDSALEVLYYNAVE